MKKIYLAMLMAAVAGTAANAQDSEGGLPWSKTQTINIENSSTAKHIVLDAPDYSQLLEQDKQDAINGVAQPYRVGGMVSAGINLKSGTWQYLEDGRKIWTVDVVIPGALALDFFYDQFKLPQGVKLFVSNPDQSQLLGAFTSANANAYNTFTHEPILGEHAHLELDVPAGVDVNDMPFNIDRISPYYRGQGSVLGTSAIGDLVAKPTYLGDASPCHKNANCPEGDGEAYDKSKSATLRIVVESGGGVGFCTGTLINNTGNSAASCRRYFLTASHCDGANSREDSHFSTWKFTYNYQYINCDGSGSLATSGATTGATFKARSNWPSFSAPSNSAVADFLLLEISSALPTAFTTYLSGWNRDPYVYEDLEKDFYIGFHHPAGDAKKMATTDFIRATGRFNQTTVNNTHWDAVFTFGGTEPGSSGSGLFDKEGLLVGDLSGGPDGTGSCEPLGTNALYSKLSYAWENEFDQTAFPTYAGAQSRVKDWLDPAGTGALTLAPTSADCPVGLNAVEAELDRSVALFPNPSSGSVNATFNFSKAAPTTVTVYNVLGALQATYELGTIKQGNVRFDLANVPSGIYLFKITAGGNSIAKRVAITH